MLSEKTLSKKQARWAKQINKVFAKNRTMPFDIKDQEDLENIIKLASGKYMDVQHFSDETENLLEDLDGSIEEYYPAEYINDILEGPPLGTPNNIQKSYYYLRKVVTLLGKEKEEASKICVVAWKIFFECASEELLLKYTGSSIEIKNCEFLTKNLLNKLTSNIEWPFYTYKSAEVIGKAIRNYLENGKVETVD